MHTPFRARRGSGGVDDDERLVRSWPVAQFRTGAVVVGVGLQTLQTEHTIVGADDGIGGAVGPGDHDREVRMFLAQTEIHVEIVELLERRRREDPPNLGVGRHIADFLAPVDRHDRHGDDAKSRQRGEHLHELHPARQVHGGGVTGPPSLPVQTDGEPLRTVEELPEGQRAGSVGRKHLVGVVFDALDQQVVECVGRPQSGRVVVLDLLPAVVVGVRAGLHRASSVLGIRRPGLTPEGTAASNRRMVRPKGSSLERGINPASHALRHCGERFSLKASTPSVRSSVVKASASWACR